MLNFDNHSVFIKPSFGYCIIRIKKNSLLDRETVASIISINETFIELGFYRFMVDIKKGVSSNTKAVDHLNINGNQSKLERIAFVDENINNIQIYPNPASHFLNITSNSNEISEIMIKDMAGKVIYVDNFNSIIIINTEGYSKGIYLIDIKNNNSVYSKKISIK